MKKKTEPKDAPKTKTGGEKSKSKKDFLVVGLGASAGGVKALQEFFATMPPDSGMAFVAILHLSPEHESSLPQILQAQTAMKVTQVTKTVKVEPNNVYVIPPNVQLEMVDGIIRPKTAERPTGHRIAIDVFFRTLAEAYQRNAVCVVLSGTGSDGTLGLKRVKESNGFAIVQDPEDAEYDSMPRSAINTQLADWVLPVHQMPEKLIHFRESSERLHLTNGADPQKIAEEIHADESLREILTLLRVRTGHDFSNYKTPTLVRRIARHLQIHELEDIPSYLELLRNQPNEIQSLLKNLLINVTNFFRDKDAFEALESETVPNLFAGKTGKDTVRIWSAGCASGEEAFSLAMLLTEYADNLSDPPKIQVFASDVDDEAIAEAREHRYPESIEADVSPERLKRFFTKEGTYYRVKKELRETVLFAPHNVLRDPPFSRLDLVSCRNLLIYLNRETQERVLQIFHFALNSSGYLFLGSSETAENVATMYSPINKKHRIYSRRNAPAAQNTLPVMPVVGRWEVRMPEKKSETVRERAMTLSDIHYRLLENYAPSSALVNQDFDIVYLSGTASRFLRFTGGEPSRNLLKAIVPDLLPDLRAALFTAQREHKSSEFPNIRVRVNGEETTINLIVRTVAAEDEASDFLLVIFEEKNSPLVQRAADREILKIADKDEAMETVVRRLEEDLQRTKEHLRSTIEQHETTVEELKASNEELQAINEELRSASEELETSKEELQSVNEELTTVNHELKDKIDETSRINSDLSNLMAATDIATIFLDKQLKIKRYTPPVEHLFNITPNDVGRPLEHFTHRLRYENLSSDAEKALRSLITIEHEITDDKSRSYLSRFAPYRTIDDRIDGVVLNFIDITDRKRAEAAVRESEQKYRTLFNSMDEGVSTLEVIFDENERVVDFTYLENNQALTRLTGLTHDITGKRVSEVIPDLEAFWFEVYGRVARTGTSERVEHFIAALDRWFDIFVARVGGADSRNLVVVYNNVTERRESERKLTDLNRLLQAMFDNSLQIIQLFKAVRDEKSGEIVDFEWLMTNARWNELYGAMAGKRLLAENPAVVETGLFDQFKQVTETGVSITQEHYYPHEQFDGWFLQTVAKVDDGFLLATIDITERKQAEIALQSSEEKYRTLFDSIDEGYLLCEVICDENEKPVDILYLEANPAAVRLAGRDFAGRRMRELDSNYEDYWYEMIGRVALTGESLRAEHYAEPHGRWFDFYASKVGDEKSRRVASVFHDITERKRTEANLAFLAEITQDLMGWTSIEDAMNSLGAKIASYLNLSACAFAELDEAEAVAYINYGWHRRDVGSVLGTYRMEEFMTSEVVENCRAGKAVIVRDVFADPRFDGEQYAAVNVGSFVSIPLVRGGKWLFLLVVYRTEPYNWRDDEIELIREITNRIWTRLERARAEENLHDSEEKFRTLFNSIDAGFCTIEVLFDEKGEAVDYRFLEINPAFVKQTGLEDAVGKLMRDLAPDHENFWFEIYGEIAKTGKPKRFEHVAAALGRFYDVYAFRMGEPSENKVAILFNDFAERRKAEELLAKSEEHFRAIVDQNLAGIFEIDLSGKIIFSNDEFCRMLGYECGTLAELTLEDFIHPEDLPESVKKLTRMQKSKKPFDMEKRFVRKDGSVVWVHNSISPITNGDKRIHSAVIVSVDITDRKKADILLREAEERMRITLEAAELATWEWNLESGEVLWNEQHFRLFGMKPRKKKMTPDDFFRHVHPDHREYVGEKLKKSVEDKVPFDVEFCAVLNNGKTRWMSGYGRVTKTGEKGETTKMSGVMFDITDRKTAAEALRKNEEQLQLILESTKDYSIITFNLKGIITRWNTGAEKIFGWTESEMVGKKGDIIFTPEDRHANVPEKEFATALKKGRAEDERWHLRKDGSRFFASGVMQPLKDGEIEGFVKIARDQTEKLKVETALREKEMLRQFVRTQEDERQRIAREIHDHLGQELTVLRLKLDDLKKTYAKTDLPEAGNLAVRIDELQKISAQLDLDVDFLAWELRPSSLEDLGLRLTLQNFVKEWSNYSGVKTGFHTTGMGKTQLTNEVETNLYRIAQEALNNISKHAKATDVSVLLEKRKDVLTLIVEDDGIGFNVNAERKGTKGLGIVGMRERANIIGGEFEIESQKGKGTTVYVRVPVNSGKSK